MHPAHTWTVPRRDGSYPHLCRHILVLAIRTHFCRLSSTQPPSRPWRTCIPRAQCKLPAAPTGNFLSILIRRPRRLTAMRARLQMPLGCPPAGLRVLRAGLKNWEFHSDPRITTLKARPRGVKVRPNSVHCRRTALSPSSIDGGGESTTALSLPCQHSVGFQVQGQC